LCLLALVVNRPVRSALDPSFPASVDLVGTMLRGLLDQTTNGGGPRPNSETKETAKRGG
jgi:hypothetical protein